MHLIRAIAICLLVTPAVAQEARDERPPHAVSDGGSVSLTFENDIFGGTDENYTNGIRLTFVTARNELPWIGRFARRNLNWLTDATDWYGTFALVQNIYTPVEITFRPPDADDRPYAGFSYVSVGISADRGDRLDTWALDLGVVG
ncbi:MAG: lipid A-modifier LpxR family protein, partial [Pseudomonadota bacterium]